MTNADMSRRNFAATLLVGGTVVATGTSASAQSTQNDDLELPNEPVEVTVSIVWLPNGDPVLGASIFKHEENELLGKTDAKGEFVTTVPNGATLRLVEPAYGKQQALRLVQGERTPNKSVRVSRVGEGWTIG